MICTRTSALSALHPSKPASALSNQTGSALLLHSQTALAKNRANSRNFPSTVHFSTFQGKKVGTVKQAKTRPSDVKNSPYIRERRSFANELHYCTVQQDPLFDPPPAHKTEQHSKPTPDGMPAWLKKHLEEKTGGFRASRWTRCPRCQAIILKGLDDDIAACTATADPTPLTPRQEELCAWIGRPTYMVTMNPNRIELDRRSQYAIGKPCTRPIVPAHRCGKRSHGFLLPHDASTHEQDANNAPPF